MHKETTWEKLWDTTGLCSRLLFNGLYFGAGIGAGWLLFG